MLIKRVVIQGFKTFAKRTEFVFDPGVTAIVGPNGSGKSNVVDAIRWCLGEQSFSLLRSKKTSDVIFSGSDHKARLGMAQVSLLLDNSAGELPVDFTEVEITRRAYRDGDNEYLLNGQRVRLADITDLLAQTGLGRRTYAVIGQGLIDRVLSLAPEDLRSLFEEAAGITGYQAKRSATLRRLDATQQNLTRVQDILNELSPRLGYLKKQAERAKERDEIARHLRDMLREWYGYHWHTTLAELDQRHATAEQFKQKLETEQAELAGLTQNIEQNRTRQATLRSELGELHRNSSRLHRDADEISRELAVNQERLRQLQARQEEARRERAPLQLQIETHQNRLYELAQQVQAAETTLERRNQAVEAIQAEVDAQQSNREALQATLAQARREMEEVQRAQTETQSSRSQTAERSKQLADEHAQQTAAQTNAENEAKRLEEELQGALQALAQAEDITRQHQAQIAEHESARASLREHLAHAEEERQQAERALDRLQTRHDLLARLQREGAGYAGGVRAILNAAHSGGEPRLQGILGTVASLLHVPPKLDKAIDTALGGAYQNVIAETWAAAQAAIDYLKQNHSGRATFLPLDRLSVPPPIDAPQMPGVLGNAAELVDFDTSIADAIHQLLNRTWVVQDLPTARAALDQITRGPRPTVVTLSGEIVRPGGAVTGGSDNQRRDDSILARERELRELPDQIRQAQRALQEKSAARQTLVEEEEQHAVAVARRQSALQTDEQHEREVRQSVETARRNLDRAQQTVQWHTQRLETLAQELAAQTDRRAELDARLTKLDQQRRQAQAALEQADADFNAVGTGDLLRRLADVRAEAAQAEAAYEHQQSLLASQEQALQTTQEQLAAKTQQLEQLGEEETQLKQQIEKLAAREDELSQEIAGLHKKIDPGETQLADWEAKQAALETQERQRQEQLRRTESSWNAAQLQFQRTEDRLQQLRHDIEQDLGLVLLEVDDDLTYQPPLPWETIVDQIPPQTELTDGLEDDIRTMRARLNRVSNVNPDAPREYAEAAERHEHLLTQSDDLEKAIGDLRKIIRELDEVMERELTATFNAVAEQFVHFFQALFDGGTAKLILADPNDITNSGIEIVARPPGKRPQSLALLSGGERTLTACALIFAILRVSPTPFCILDEVDAALDEANVDRFRRIVEELSQGTQFILITHNRRTLEGTNAIYGITMSSDGASRVISLRLDGQGIVREKETAEPGSDEDVSTIQELVQM